MEQSVFFYCIPLFLFFVNPRTSESEYAPNWPGGGGGGGDQRKAGDGGQWRPGQHSCMRRAQ